MKFKKISKIILLIVFILLLIANGFSKDKDIYLIIRSDDIGSSHAANIGCIKAFDEGISKTVEIMVPCPWFLEAVKMLKDRPNYDVGVHLTLTSEWENYKWGPLTYAPSMVDSNGYFYPRQKDWVNENAEAFWNANPDIKEVEVELRAQIEMAMKHIPQVSHISGHMGINSTGVSQEMYDLVKKLAIEYDLDIDPSDFDIIHFGSYGEEQKIDQEQDAESKFIETLKKLKPGKYLYVEHPGMNVPEMKAAGHDGYWKVAEQRDNVTKILTSEKVKKIIKKRNIKLISYKDLKDLEK